MYALALAVRGGHRLRASALSASPRALPPAGSAACRGWRPPSLPQRYSVLYREAASATCFYVLIGGTLLEHSNTPTWTPPEPKPGERENRSRFARERRTLTCDRRANCVFTLFGMEALLGRTRSSTISVLDDAEVLKFHASDLNIRKDGAAKVARKVRTAPPRRRWGSACEGGGEGG